MWLYNNIYTGSLFFLYQNKFQILTYYWRPYKMLGTDIYLSHDHQVIQCNNPCHKIHIITRVITPARLPTGYPNYPH